MEQFRAMDAALTHTIAIGMLMPSIEVNERMLVAVSIKTLTDNDLKWEEAASNLIEEVTAPPHGLRSGERSSAVDRCCYICGKSDHKTVRCFLNLCLQGTKWG